MDFFKNFKLDTWWAITLYLGIGLVAASLFLEPEFITPKNLFGLGIGMVLIGISHAVANKHMVLPQFGGYWRWTEIRHSIPTIILFTTGLVLCLVFGIKLFLELI